MDNNKLRRRRGGEAEEENRDEARIVSSSADVAEDRSEDRESWTKVESTGEYTSEVVGEREGKEEHEHDDGCGCHGHKGEQQEVGDRTVKEADEHPFLQQRRRKKKYPAPIVFCTTIYWKIIHFFLMTAVPFLQLYHLPLLKEEVLGDGWFATIFTLFWAYFVSMYLFSYLMTTFSNPGRPQEIETLEEYPVASDLAELNMKYVPRWCTSCQCWKPPRTHHCGICDRCTLRMDHHCPFMGNCIGLDNLGYFLTMFLFAGLGLITFGIPLLLTHLSTFWLYLAELANVAVPNLIGDNWYYVLPVIFRLPGFIFVDVLYGAIANVFQHNDVSFALLAVLNTFTLTAPLSMGSNYIFMMFRNTTVIEQQLKNSSEYVVLMKDVVVPIGATFYQRELLSNVKEALGDKLWRRLLPIPAQIPQKVGTHPKVSIFVSQILQSRVVQVNTEGCQIRVGNMEDLGIVTEKKEAL